MLSPKFTNIVIYDEEAHWLVKVLTQRNLFEATTGVANKMEKTHKQNTSIWSSPEVKFLVQGFEVAQETWRPENSPSKKCRHVGIPVIFSSMYNVRTKGLLAVV